MSGCVGTVTTDVQRDNDIKIIDRKGTTGRTVAVTGAGTATLAYGQTLDEAGVVAASETVNAGHTAVAAISVAPA